MNRTVEVRFNEDEGLYHVILIHETDEFDVGAFCDEADAEQTANDINRWSQM